jgi:hypothetical protein
LFLTDLDDAEGCLTYNEWLTTLETIAADRYWSKVPSESRCTHIVPSEQEVSDSDGSAPKHQGSTFVVDVKSNKVAIQQRKSYSKKKKSPKRAKTKQSKTNIEDLILTSSGPSSESGNSDDHSEQSDDESWMAQVPISQQVQTRCGHDGRSVVTPPVFEMDGRMSLKDYLHSFERYFDNKFRGNEVDKANELGKFLSGDLLRVYEVKGGKRQKYHILKEHLLAYYKKKKIGGKSYWKSKLFNASPDLDEPFDIYGMRLTELAQRAYPNSKKECASQLRHHFLQALPPNIRAKIADMEGAVKITTGGKQKHLPFSGLVEMAKDMQEAGHARKSIMWASQPASGTSATRDHGNSRQKEQPKASREFRPSLRQSDQGTSQNKVSVSRKENEDNSKKDSSNIPNKKSSPVTPKKYQDRRSAGGHNQSQSSDGRSPADSSRCSYCRKPGHFRRDCWRALRVCLICGKSHSMEDCPKFDPNYRNRSRAQGNSMGSSSN